MYGVERDIGYIKILLEGPKSIHHTKSTVQYIIITPSLGNSGIVEVKANSQHKSNLTG